MRPYNNIKDLYPEGACRIGEWVIDYKFLKQVEFLIDHVHETYGVYICGKDMKCYSCEFIKVL